MPARFVPYVEAAKLSFATALVYAIALWMEWPRPFWAVVSVIFCSLDTTGASLNKSMLRCVGTLFAIVLAGVLAGWLGQDRWSVFAVYGVLVGVVAYVMQRTRYMYALLIGLIVALLVFADAYPSYDGFFEIATQRIGETFLGVLVYLAVSAVVLPIYAGDRLARQVREQAGHLDALFALGRKALHEPVEREAFDAERDALMSGAAGFADTLWSAKSDTAAVRRDRDLWKRLQADMHGVYDAILLLREGADVCRGLDLRRLIPGGHDVGDRIAARLAAFARDGVDPGPSTGEDGPLVDEPDVPMVPAEDLHQTLDAVHLAGVVGLRDQIERLDRATRDLLLTARAVAGRVPPSDLPADPELPPAVRAPLWDREVFLNAMRVVVTWVFVFLLWVFVPDIPGGMMILVLGTVWAAMTCSLTPADPLALLRPAVIGIVWAAPFCLFVLPRLHGPWELMGVIAILCFGPAVLGAQGRVMDKFFILLAVAGMTPIENQPVYTFATIFAFPIVLLLSIMIPVVTFALLPSSRPEIVLLRRTRELFRACAEYTRLRTRELRGESGLSRRTARLRARILSLPEALRALAPSLDQAVTDDPVAVARWLGAIQSVAFRLVAFEDARQRAHSEDREIFDRVQGLGTTVRESLSQLFGTWATTRDGEVLRALHAECAARVLEIEEAFAGGEVVGPASEGMLRRLFGVLGTARELVQDLGRLEDQAGRLDLERWTLPRFS